MKLQIERFSLHQNAKVFAVLMAVSTAVFIVPMMLVMALFTIDGNEMAGAGLVGVVMVLLIAPAMYFVFGYIVTLIGLALYNFLFRYIGGIEYTARQEQL